jgi:hypothetical protein
VSWYYISSTTERATQKQITVSNTFLASFLILFIPPSLVADA